MEYLEGKSLNVLLDEEFGRGMPFSHAWPIIEDVGAALGNAHDHNVIHSDLKPANVFVTTSGRTKLLDFGIARVSRGPFLHAHSGPRALTPAYASCEMLEGKEADQRDDIYSFACVIYEMLSGKRPFGNVDALEARKSGTRVQPLGLLTQGQNAALAQALAFDREGRTSSVEQLIEALGAHPKSSRQPIAVLGAAIVGALVVAGLTYLLLDKLGVSRHSGVVQSVATKTQIPVSPATPTAVFNPPPHSIAVLPFVNMSGDKEQEYFSEGLTEELLNSLSRINQLQVAARTSSFSFEGEHPDISTVAHKLNVGSVLEGSVRRSAHTVRVTAQLVNGVTGFHVWSETYDRDLGDVLKLQTEIATAVASALKVTLLGDVAAKIEAGGTRNPAAFDAYLRASKAYREAESDKELQAAIAGYTKAIRLDPEFALAYADRSLALTDFGTNWTTRLEARSDYFNNAQVDAGKASVLAPDLAQGHLALASLFESSLQYIRASHEYDRALALEPGNARVLREYGSFAVKMGQTEAGLDAAHRAVALDPLNATNHFSLGVALLYARLPREAIAAFTNARALAPDSASVNSWLGFAYYAIGDFQSSLKACESVQPANNFNRLFGLAITYHKLGRHADAETALAQLRTSWASSSAIFNAMIYAEWGDTAVALQWLDTAMRVQDPYLEYVKMHVFFDPLRNEPRFQAIERALKFPD